MLPSLRLAIQSFSDTYIFSHIIFITASCEYAHCRAPNIREGVVLKDIFILYLFLRRYIRIQKLQRRGSSQLEVFIASSPSSICPEDWGRTMHMPAYILATNPGGLLNIISSSKKPCIPLSVHNKISLELELPDRHLSSASFNLSRTTSGHDLDLSRKHSSSMGAIADGGSVNSSTLGRRIWGAAAAALVLNELWNELEAAWFLVRG